MLNLKYIRKTLIVRAISFALVLVLLGVQVPVDVVLAMPLSIGGSTGEMYPSKINVVTLGDDTEGAEKIEWRNVSGLWSKDVAERDFDTGFNIENSVYLFKTKEASVQEAPIESTGGGGAGVSNVEEEVETDSLPSVDELEVEDEPSQIESSEGGETALPDVPTEEPKEVLEEDTLVEVIPVEAVEAASGDSQVEGTTNLEETSILEEVIGFFIKNIPVAHAENVPLVPESKKETGEFINSEFIEFSDFKYDESDNASTSTISSAELKISMSAVAIEGAVLLVEYSKDGNSWTTLKGIEMDPDKNIFPGVFSIKLPDGLASELADLNFRISYKYHSGQEVPETLLFVDSLWVETFHSFFNLSIPLSDTGEILEEKKDDQKLSSLELSTRNIKMIVPGSLEQPFLFGDEEKNTEQLVISPMVENAQSLVKREDGFMVYENVYPDTNLRYETTNSGLKEYIDLLEKEHPDEFKYHTNISSFDVVQVSDTEIDLYKKDSGQNPLSKLYTIKAPVMYDSAGNTSSSIVLNVEGDVMKLVPDKGWLSNATYPVVVDPIVEISVLNLHSHPVEGDLWEVEFTTVGVSDLTITPADQATVDEDEFTSLFCGSEDRTSSAQILDGDVIYYPDWSCDDVAKVSHMTLVTGNHHLVFDFGGERAEAFNAAYVWDGGGGDALWSTAANWSSNIVPTGSDTVTFNNTCVSNCNPTIAADTSVAGITMASTYAGTITLSDTYTLTIGTSGFSQSGGTFTGGVATTSVGGALTISGGTFNAASTTVFAGGNYTININSSQTFHHLSFNGTSGTAKTISASDTLIALGNLFLTDSIVNLTTYATPSIIDARGDVFQSSTFDGGTAIVDFGNDSAAQTWTAGGGVGLTFRLNSASDANDNISISAATTFQGATVTSAFVGTIPISNPSAYDLTFGVNSTIPAWAQAAGTFNGGVGTTTFINSSFTVSGGTFNAASTTVFSTGNYNIDINTTQNFHHMIINGSGGTYKTVMPGDTLIVNGTLDLTDGGVNASSASNPGVLDARGNINQSSTFDGGTVVVDFGNDSVSQSLTISGGTFPILRLNSAADASDSIVISAAPVFTGATITSSFAGVIPISNPSVYDLSFGLTNGSTAAWQQAAGTFNGGIGTTTISNTFTISGGTFNAATTTVLAGGNYTIDVVSSHNFHDLKINGSSLTTRTIASGDTLVVNGTLFLMSGNVGTGNISAMGNIIQSSSMEGSTAVVDFANDSLSQTWTVSGGTGPVLRLNSAADASDNILITTDGGFYGATVTSAFVGNIPFSNSGNYNVTFGTSGYLQAAGTFNGWAGTTTVSGAFTISGGTYNAATNTAVTGLSTTLDFNSSQEFYNFYFNQNNIAGKTVSAGDTLIVLNNLFFNDGQVNSTGIIEARGDVWVASVFDGATSPLNFTGTNNQSFNLTGATGVYNGDITVNKSAGAVSLASALVMDAASQDLKITLGTFDVNANNLTVNGTSGTLQASSTAVLKLQGDETFTLNSGNPLLATSSVVEYSGSSSYTIKDWNYGGLTISGSGTFATPNASEDITGSFTQSAGTFTAPSGTLTVSKNFAHTGGTFTHNSGTVSLNGGDQTVSGNTTFNNFTKSTSTADTLTFASGSTQTIAGTLTLSGAASNRLSLRSSSSGVEWSINPQSTRTISYLDVQDSNNTNATAMDAVSTNSVSRGNNTNWDFGESFTQSDYRWYQNVDSLSVTTPLSGQNSSLTLSSVSDPLRLRMNVLVGGIDLATSSKNFKLQVSNLSSGGWQDIESTTTVSFYNNPSITSQTTLTSLLLTTSNATGTYEEANPSESNPFLVAIGQLFEFDFSLDVSDLVSNATYFFRMVLSDGTGLDFYDNYAQVVYDPNTSPDAPSSLGAAGLVNGSWTSDNTPPLSFTISDPDVSDTVKYHVVIDDSSDFSSPVMNSTSALAAQGTFTYTSGSLSNGSYYWRVSASDDGGLSSATTTANSGSIAFKVDATDPDPGTLTITSVDSTSVTMEIAGASDSGSGLTATPYNFSNYSAGGSSGATANTSWTFSSLSPATSYTFRVFVSDVAGNSITTALVSTTTSAASSGDSGGGSSESSGSSGSSSGRGPVSSGGTTPTPVVENPIIPVAGPVDESGGSEIEEVEQPATPSTSTTTPIVEAGPSATPQTPSGGRNGWNPSIPDVFSGIVDGITGAISSGIEQITGGVTDVSRGALSFFESSIDSAAAIPVRMISFTRYTVDTVQKFTEKIPEDEIKVGFTTVVIAPATLALQYSIGSSGILVRITNMHDLWVAIVGFIQGLLTTLGLRKRRRYWGTVYDAVNKQGIDPAIVELINTKTGEVVEKSVTDLFGRFGFLDRPGAYTIRASKTHYKFPSDLVKGYMDGAFNNVYHGEEFEVLDVKDVIAPNIPMDPMDKDWNQEEKARQGVGKLNARFEYVVTMLLKILFWSGFTTMFVLLVLKPSIANFIFMFVYLLLAWINRYIPDPRLSGRVVSSKYPTENLLLELKYESMPSVVVAKTVTDKKGRFFLKCAQGSYILQIKSIGDNENTLIKEINVKVGSEMILNKVFEI